MRKRNNGSCFEEKRMLSIPEAENYCGLGRNGTRRLAEQAGAIRKYGRRVLVDREAIDKALDNLATAD